MTCANCGKHFYTDEDSALHFLDFGWTCSDRCHRELTRPKYGRKCEHCGKDFDQFHEGGYTRSGRISYADDTYAVYCSYSCYEAELNSAREKSWTLPSWAQQSVKELYQTKNPNSTGGAKIKDGVQFWQLRNKSEDEMAEIIGTSDYVVIHLLRKWLEYYEKNPNADVAEKPRKEEPEYTYTVAGITDDGADFKYRCTFCGKEYNDGNYFDKKIAKDFCCMGHALQFKKDFPETYEECESELKSNPDKLYNQAFDRYEYDEDYDIDEAYKDMKNAADLGSKKAMLWIVFPSGIMWQMKMFHPCNLEDYPDESLDGEVRVFYAKKYLNSNVPDDMQKAHVLAFLAAVVESEEIDAESIIAEAVENATEARNIYSKYDESSEKLDNATSFLEDIEKVLASLKDQQANIYKSVLLKKAEQGDAESIQKIERIKAQEENARKEAEEKAKREAEAKRLVEEKKDKEEAERKARLEAEAAKAAAARKMEENAVRYGLEKPTSTDAGTETYCEVCQKKIKFLGSYRYGLSAFCCIEHAVQWMKEKFPYLEI